MIQNGQGVLGHVLHAVGCFRFQAEFLLQHEPQQMGCGCFIHGLRQTDVAVVKPHHAKPCLVQLMHHVIGPDDELHGHARDQQHRWPIPLSRVFHFQAQAIGKYLHLVQSLM